MGKKVSEYFIIGTFVSLYIITSLISTIHVIDFFEMSNPHWLAVSLAIAFEVGAAASLASIITLEKMNKGIVWALFVLLTAMQAMGNAFYAYTHLHEYQSWVELFGLVDSEVIEQKRILSVISGAILPLVALGFIKSLVDYLKPSPIVATPKLEEHPIGFPTYRENEPEAENVVVQGDPIVVDEPSPIKEAVTITGNQEIHQPIISKQEIHEKEQVRLKTTEETPSVLDKIHVFKGNGN